MPGILDGEAVTKSQPVGYWGTPIIKLYKLFWCVPLNRVQFLRFLALEQVIYFASFWYCDHSVILR